MCHVYTNKYLLLVACPIVDNSIHTHKNICATCIYRSAYICMLICIHTRIAWIFFLMLPLKSLLIYSFSRPNLPPNLSQTLPILDGHPFNNQSTGKNPTKVGFPPRNARQGLECSQRADNRDYMCDMSPFSMCMALLLRIYDMADGAGDLRSWDTTHLRELSIHVDLELYIHMHTYSLHKTWVVPRVELEFDSHETRHIYASFS